MAKKDSLYFPHDHNAKDDEKILELRAEFGAEGYGIYWMLIESMFNNNGYLNRGAISGLCLGYGVAKDTLKPIIDFGISIGLFSVDGIPHDMFTSIRVLDHLEFREKAISNGKKGANARWSKVKNGDPNGGANATPIPVKERKVSKVKKRKPFIPPTLDEVSIYCIEQKNNVDPEKFIAYYQARGWKLKSGDIKCWKSCVKTWEKNNDNRAPGNISTGSIQQSQGSGGKFANIGTVYHVPDVPADAMQDGTSMQEDAGDTF